MPGLKDKLRDLKAARKAVNLLQRLHRKYPLEVPEINDADAVALELCYLDLIEDIADGERKK